MQNKDNSSLIIYPRAYNKRGEQSLHSVMGVTTDGIEVNVKLRIDDIHKGKKGAPSISEFSRDDYKANNFCIASPENSPEQREGVLIFSQVSEDGVSSKGLQNYIAKWGSVLAQHAQSPDPIIGYGRLDINKNSPKILELRKLLSEAKRSGASNEDISGIESQINNPANYYYFSVLYKTEQIEEINLADPLFIKRCSDLVNESKKGGIIGGVYIRAIKPNGDIYPDRFIEVFSRFVRSQDRYENGVETIKRIATQDISGWVSEGLTVEVIPIIKINAGASATRYYSRQKQHEFACKTFFDKDGFPQLCKVAIRIDYIKDQGLILLNRIHPISNSLGNPKLIGEGGVFNRKLANNNQVESEAGEFKPYGIEIPVGIINNSVKLSRSPWFYSSKLLVVSHEEDTTPNELNNTGETEGFLPHEKEVASNEPLIRTQIDESNSDLEVVDINHKNYQGTDNESTHNSNNPDSDNIPNSDYITSQELARDDKLVHSDVVLISSQDTTGEPPEPIDESTLPPIADDEPDDNVHPLNEGENLIHKYDSSDDTESAEINSDNNQVDNEQEVQKEPEKRKRRSGLAAFLKANS